LHLQVPTEFGKFAKTGSMSLEKKTFCQWYNDTSERKCRQLSQHLMSRFDNGIGHVRVVVGIVS
jgi:hypothetical protein